MSAAPDKKPILILTAVVALLAAGLLTYSQTIAFAWDEGFHLLTAQLIQSGKRPYLDFVFPQTPLNAYWNAAWMSIFGATWRATHAVAALMTALAVWLASGFVLSRFPKPGWRLACSLTCALLIGLSVQVFDFGTIAQAYGFCLFLIVAAFRAAVASVHRSNVWLAAAAGFLASAAAASSLLTAPVAPVLLIWILISNRAGSRLAKAAAFAASVLIAFLPVIWLFAEGARQVFFNVIEYNFRYRQVNWEGAVPHNLEVLTSWIDSWQALLLGLLAIAGLLFLAVRSDWDRSLRAEFYLCGWLVLALGLHVSTAAPTFERYYLLLAPFLAILAAAGLYALGSRLFRPDRPWRSVALVSVLFALPLAKSLYESRDDFNWKDAENLAAIVDQVTPRPAPLLADELIYFLTRHPPPSGMELADSHKLGFLPAATLKLLHIVPQAELDRRVKAGDFQTIQTCGENAHALTLDLPRLYKKQKPYEDCTVFWDYTR
ncbi:MAG TPA: hypothetical protein VEV17_22555 [Bryobacteraceae bacterium]|nr:hypothetical protein [Bryobacteraceae bacterium]